MIVYINYAQSINIQYNTATLQCINESQLSKLSVTNSYLNTSSSTMITEEDLL